MSNPTPTSPDSSQTITETTRDDTRRIVIRVAIDVVILAAIAIATQIVYLVWTPFKRGFFCDDRSLMYPYREPTIAGWAFFAIGTVLPVGVLVGTELARSRVKTPARARPLRLRNLTVPFWFVEAYKSIGMFGFGATGCQLLTLVAKFTVGRLRPHFFDVCRPVLPDGTDCGDAANRGRYIEQFYCSNNLADDDLLQQLRLSFPSGQTAIAVYSAVYCAVYLQARLNWDGSSLLKHLLQLALVALACYASLSRVSDYGQHWSDVAAGALLGALVACVVANYWTSLFDKQRKGIGKDAAVRENNGDSSSSAGNTAGGVVNPGYVSAA